MEDMDKTIEVMKAAMEKERLMKSQNNKENKEQEDKDMQNQQNMQNDNLDNKAEGKAYTADNSNADDNMQQGTDAAGMQEADNVEAAAFDADETAEEADGSDADNVAETEEKQAKGKGFFKSSKSKELEAKEAKIAELTDRLMRAMAEFDNYRKRTEKEKAMMYDLGVKSILEKILPVVDNFERGLASVAEEDKNSSFVQGIELIYKQLMTILDDIGLKPIDAVGKEFDPNLHNAVMHGEDENLGANIVSEEFQKGYTYRDMVVRHSMVKVVN